MKDREETIRRLSAIWRSSSSAAEFRLKAAVAGGVGVWTALLFMAYVFRKKHSSGFELGELAALGLGAAAFSVWGGIVGPKSAAAGCCILALSLAVMSSLTLLLIRFDTLCDFMSEIESGRR